MTSEIGAPGAGTLAVADGLLVEETVLVVTGELVCECPARSPAPCEHPAISNVTATNAAIRIQSG
ncbi:hypothetical protein LRC484719_09090 [Mycobacterium riyadhense]